MPFACSTTTFRLAPALAGAALVLAGCTTATPPNGGGSSASAATSAATVLPLSVHVSGGLRGLDDTVTVAADGATTGSVRGATVRCTLTPDALAALSAAAASDLAPGAPSTTAPGGDLIVTSVIGPTGVAHGVDGREVPEVARLGAELVADVARPEGQRTLCR